MPLPALALETLKKPSQTFILLENVVKLGIREETSDICESKIITS